MFGTARGTDPSVAEKASEDGSVRDVAFLAQPATLVVIAEFLVLFVVPLHNVVLFPRDDLELRLARTGKLHKGSFGVLPCFLALRINQLVFRAFLVLGTVVFVPLVRMFVTYILLHVFSGRITVLKFLTPVQNDRSAPRSFASSLLEFFKPKTSG
jgi:hypothetical protein